MGLRTLGSIGACFVVMSMIVIGGLLGPGLLSSLNSPGDARYNQLPITATAHNAIVAENAHAGTTTWKIPVGNIASTQIQAYTSAASVFPGQKLSFYVSTAVDGTQYLIAIYRLGWYQGFGGRFMATSGNLIGHAQGYYDSANLTLVDCSTCRLHLLTGLVEANWVPSYTLTIPQNWTSGIYLAKFTDANGMQTYASFVVRNHTHSLYVAVTPDTTNVAYNTWGGYSLYEGTKMLAKAVKVSFDRPSVQGEGASQVLKVEADALHWLERQGYDLSYISDVDLHTDPAQLLQHRAYLSLGHDEYWTKEMRDGVEHARDHGVGLAFLGANASYWQMRFEADSAGTPERTIVCYKVSSYPGYTDAGEFSDLKRDPLYGKDTARVTAEWRDPVLARPENALIGIMFSDFTHQQQDIPWRVNLDVRSSLLQGSGLQLGQQYGCGIVGNEWDHVFANGATPPGLVVLSTSPTLNDINKPDYSNTTYYIARSGAMVFATGSIYWTSALDSYRYHKDSMCAAKKLVVPELQRLMSNVMAELIIFHPTGKL